MNTFTKLVASAAVLATLAVPSIASAQAAIVLPPSYAWGQSETPNFPTDARAHAPRHSHIHPYGQW
jgi:hypothetical protein